VNDRSYVALLLVYSDACDGSRDMHLLHFSINSNVYYFLLEVHQNTAFCLKNVKNFPGDYTPGPPWREGSTPSLHPPQHGLQPCARALCAPGPRDPRKWSTPDFTSRLRPWRSGILAPCAHLNLMIKMHVSNHVFD
jgi:hypothetical protein